MAVDMGAAGDVRRGRHGGGDLNVVERVIERQGGDELAGELECARLAQHLVTPGQAGTWREPQVGAGSARPLEWSSGGDEFVDFEVGRP
jgi:hypothetical protein